MNKIKILFIALAFVIIGAGIAVFIQVSAWNNPTATPPNGDSALYYASSTESFGIGTNNPGAPLQITRGADATNTNIPALRLHHNTRRTYELGTYYDGTLRIKDVDSGAIRVTLDSNGYLGIGTTTPGAALHVLGADGDANGGIRIASASMFRGIFGTATGDLNFNNGVNAGQLNSAGNWIGGSDISYKTNIADMSKYGLNTVMQMKPREYQMKDTGIQQVGFIAQEMRNIVPEVVSGTEGSLGISYGQITPILAKAIQELHVSLEQLKKENAELKLIICEERPEEQICLK